MQYAKQDMAWIQEMPMPQYGRLASGFEELPEDPKSTLNMLFIIMTLLSLVLMSISRRRFPV